MLTMRSLGWSWRFFILLFLILVPLALPFGSVGDKPIDFTYSDLVLLGSFVSFIYYLFRGIRVSHAHARLLLAGGGAFFIFLFLGIFAVILDASSFLPLLSNLRFSKHLLFVFVAYVAYLMFKPSQLEVVRYSGLLAVVMVFALFASDMVFNPVFPSSRWGGFFFDFETYGFPNSVAVYYSLYLSMILVFLHLSKNAFLLPVVFLLVLIVFFTFSRAAWVTLLIAVLPVLFYSLFRSARLALLYGAAFAVLLFSIVPFYVHFKDVIDPWMYKIDTLTGKDISLSGREYIWAEALSLINSRPLFGYFFEPFSNYVSGYDTPHQQYLEILYKSGIFGFLVYFGFFTYLFSLFSGAGFRCGGVSRVIVYYFGFLVLGVFVSNLGQPNLSFSLLGNALIFFIALYYFVFTGEAVRYVSDSSRSQ